MSKQSAARKQKRVLAAAGVAAYARGFLPINRVTSATLAGVLESTLDTLVDNGGDLTGRLRIDIGQHPQYPGRTTVEVKTDKLLPKPEPVEDHSGDCSDPRCPIDHTDAGADDD